MFLYFSPGVDETNEYLGIQNGDIPDANIQASHVSSKGRLCSRSPFHKHVTGNPWIQANIGYQTRVSGVVTQGDGQRDGDWVTSFWVSTSPTSSANALIYIQENGQRKVSVII